VQEIAFAFSNAIAYIEGAIKAGQKVDDFAPGISWIFTAGLNLFEEIAKFRAARRLWARLMKERFGATVPKAMMLRFHTHTAGSVLTAQQPLNNAVRVTWQALSAILGGTQSMACCAYDEALALPTKLPQLWRCAPSRCWPWKAALPIPSILWPVPIMSKL
jgi:methylmalonyl-CoA mutase N-terminal domain/subunit